MPVVTLAFVFARNVSATLPPPGIVNDDHAGEVAPTVGSVVVGLVAPPARLTVRLLRNVMLGLAGRTSVIVTPPAAPRPARLLTVIVYVAGDPAATYGVLVDLVTVSCGKHALVPGVPGMLLAGRFTIWKPPEEPVDP